MAHSDTAGHDASRDHPPDYRCHARPSEQDFGLRFYASTSPPDAEVDDIGQHVCASSSSPQTPSTLLAPSLSTPPAARGEDSEAPHQTGEDAHIVIPPPSSLISPLAAVSSKPNAIYITWAPDDPEDPMNWKAGKKWRIALTVIFFTFITAANATGYASALEGATVDLHTSREVFLLGTTTLLVMTAVAPMALAPLSEVFGRAPIFHGSMLVFLICFIPQALAPNITTMLVIRGLHGCATSAGNSMVGGTVSDMFRARERGTPMGIYSLFMFFGQALAPMCFGFIAQDPKLGWRWIFWVQMIISALCGLLLVFFLKETRGSVILSRRARKLTEETGRLHLSQADDERANFSALLTVSLTRPFLYLLTEPVVTAFSLWIAFAYGCIFILLESVPLVFAQYGFNQGEQGLVLVTILIGAVIGFLNNLHQDYLYEREAKKSGGRAPPEARLYWACIGSILFPTGMMWYAWAGRPGIHWILPALGIVVVSIGEYALYCAVFSYMADAYERYSSSALAAQSFLRNVFAGCFPLFTLQMYERLGYPIASTILASVGFALGIVPFILLFFGGRIRARSKVATALEKEDREIEERREGIEVEEKGRQTPEGRAEGLGETGTGLGKSAS